VRGWARGLLGLVGKMTSISREWYLKDVNHSSLVVSFELEGIGFVPGVICGGAIWSVNYPNNIFIIDITSQIIKDKSTIV